MNCNRPAAPLFATVNITGVCNLHCKYCFFQPRIEKHMPLSDFQRVAVLLVDAQIFFLNLSGGEPFTHPQIDKILHTAHEYFQHVVVLTNGTLLRTRHMKAISDIINQKGSFPIQVSLDSVYPDVNAQTRSDPGKIVRNIRTLSQLGANVVVAMVITRHNADTLIDSIRNLATDVRHFHIMAVQKVRALGGADVDHALDKSALNRLWVKIKLIKQELGLHIETPLDEQDKDLGTACGAPCMAAFSQIVIDPDLTVRPCDRCVETVIGNLGHQTLDEVWRSDASSIVLDSPIPFCRRVEQRIDRFTSFSRKPLER